MLGHGRIAPPDMSGSGAEMCATFGASTVRALSCVKSLSERLSARDPSHNLFGSLAEFERDLIRDRTMAGLTAGRSRGRVGGRPPALTPHKLAVARQMHASRHTPWKPSPRSSASAEQPSTATSPNRRARHRRTPGHRSHPSDSLLCGQGQLREYRASNRAFNRRHSTAELNR